MADYGYFNGLDYDETFPARYVAALIPNGVYSGELQAVPYGGMQVEVTRGRAWANGYFFDSSNDVEDTLITIPAADPTNPRTDVIVLRADLTNKLFGAVRISGTAGSNPVEPSIIRAGGIYDLKLAIVSVPAGTAEITSAMITDTRADSSVCGYTGGFITQTLQNQIDAINNSKLDASQKGIAGGVMALPSTLPATGKMLKMGNGGSPAPAVEGTDYGVRVVTLWSGTLSANGTTVQLSDAITNYKLIMVAGRNNQYDHWAQSTILPFGGGGNSFPMGTSMQSILALKDGVNLAFYFTDSTHLQSSSGFSTTAGIRAVYGIK